MGNIKIKLSQNPSETRIFLDDLELTRVESIHIYQDANSKPFVSMVILPDIVEIDGESEIIMLKRGQENES